MNTHLSIDISVFLVFLCNLKYLFLFISRPKRRFGTRSTQHLASNNDNNMSTPTAITHHTIITGKTFVPKSISTSGFHIVQQQQQQTLPILPSINPASSITTTLNQSTHIPLAVLQRKNISLSSLPNVVEGVALGPANLSTASSPTAPTGPIAVKANGGSGHSMLNAIDPKALITEDEPTTEWTPEIPFKNVSINIPF